MSSRAAPQANAEVRSTAGSPITRRAAPSMQKQLIALVLGVVALVWCLSVVITWFSVRHELDELLDGHLAQAAALLVVQQGREPPEGQRSDAPSLHRYASRAAFQVFHGGRLVLRSANAPLEPMLPLAHGGPAPSGPSTVEIGRRRWRVFAAQGAQPDVQVFVGEQFASRAEIVRAVLVSTLAPMLLLALPVMGLAVWWAVRRGMAPLHRLGTALAERPANALQPVALDGAPVEMRPMIDALDNLFVRIAGLLDAERRFTADAAHELRTPIAAIRAQAQVALGESDDAQRRRALEHTLEGCDRAARLVEQLLTLSRLEADAAPATHDIDLAALARSVVADLAPAAVARQQQVSLEAEPGCHVAGNDTLLALLLRNLLDNALRYSPPHARVEVRVSQQPGGVVLSVDDSGPGMGEAELPRLGERFFRPPGQQASGSGLGWSIAQRIAAVHGARLGAVRSPSLGGLQASVHFGTGTRAR